MHGFTFCCLVSKKLVLCLNCIGAILIVVKPAVGVYFNVYTYMSPFIHCYKWQL